MMGMNFSPPPSLQGAEAAQLVQLHRFLFQLSEQLNVAVAESNRLFGNADSGVSTAKKAATNAAALAGSAQATSVSAQNAASSAQTAASAAQDTANRAVMAANVYYAVSSSGTAAPDSGWELTPPERADGQFIWEKTVTRYGDGSTAESAPVCVTGRDGESAITVRIDSSRGTAFKNNAVSTVLTAVIYHGSHRITEIGELRRLLGPSVYLEWSWQRMEEDRFGVISAGDTRIGNDGFTLTISPSDVDVKTVFLCELKD